MGQVTRWLVVGMGLMAWAAATGWAGAGEKVPLVFSGGHEIGREDFGRPVQLMAKALGVKPEEFREAFRGVRPARGRGPTGDEARRNKAALMSVLGPLGVTNERMDEVANYYRFQPQRGELWPHQPAKGHAVMDGGRVKSIVITEAGHGYSSEPAVSIRGRDDVKVRAKLHLDRDLGRNGSVAEVTVITAQ